MEQELIPMEKIREMYKNGELIEIPKDAETSLSVAMNKQITEYIENNDDIQKDIQKQNKKKIKRFFKDKNTFDDDVSKTNVYQTRYNRETWYYKRHKDTIDKYNKKENKKQNNENDVLVVDNNEEILRIGLFKMILIVWFDLFATVMGMVAWFPIHLIKNLVELFEKMKKSIAITVIIVTIVIIVAVGLIFGIKALADLMANIR